MTRFHWERARHVLNLMWILTPLFAAMLWLLLLMGALVFPNLLTPAVSAGDAARHLLQICRLWYVVLAVVLLAGFPIIFLAGRFACRKLTGVSGAHHMPAVVVVCLIIPCLFIWAIVRHGELPGRFFQAGEDLDEIASSFLVQAEVWISPKTYPARLPGPYAEPQTEVSTRYGILGDDTNHQWVSVYVPLAMEFSPAQDRFFDETQTVAWNWEHAGRYQVSYTSHFHYVVAITPVESQGGA